MREALMRGMICCAMFALAVATAPAQEQPAKKADEQAAKIEQAATKLDQQTAKVEQAGKKAEQAAKKEVAKAGTTLENLQAAYDGESNAHAKYLAFAAKADEEGYGQVASLFRVAAQAEEIHAAAHAKIIKELGAEPTADIKQAEVKGTAENLEAAIKGETYEHTEMYPGFLKQARADKNKKAIESFNHASAAEAEHAKLYAEAKSNLAQWKEKKDFYLCPECGNVVTKLEFEKCPICYTKRGEFKKVS